MMAEYGVNRIAIKEEKFDYNVRKTCFSCKHKQLLLVKVIENEDGYGNKFRVKTLNISGVCTNKECFRYQDPKLIPSWVREEDPTPTGKPSVQRIENLVK